MWADASLGRRDPWEANRFLRHNPVMWAAGLAVLRQQCFPRRELSLLAWASTATKDRPRILAIGNAATGRIYCVCSVVFRVGAA